ncbi:MAG: DUF4126 domain-containing protein [Planctomycetota bacterium]|nr:DUF4126 domain-containing protein [Planctomycetota bacterium]
MNENYTALLGILTGLGLSAACGFRVFVPLLVASIAVRSGAIHVADDFAWIGSVPAIVCFSVATSCEIAGYFLPGVDHFLDVIATPAAIVAGTLLTASFITDMQPWFRWSLAVVAGGGIAGTVQATTVVTRAASGLLTFGLGNPVVAAGELAGATTIAILAAILPVLALLLVLVLVVWMWSRRKQPRAQRVDESAAGWGSRS